MLCHDPKGLHRFSLIERFRESQCSQQSLAIEVAILSFAASEVHDIVRDSLLIPNAVRFSRSRTVAQVPGPGASLRNEASK